MRAGVEVSRGGRCRWEELEEREGREGGKEEVVNKKLVKEKVCYEQLPFRPGAPTRP